MLNNENIIKNIGTIKDMNYLVIVEGKKDMKTLNNFGINNVVSLKNRPLFEIVENVNDREVVLLTDLDSEGRKLFNKLRHLLQRRGVKINNILRNNLFRTKLRNIEGLDSYLKLFDF